MTATLQQLYSNSTATLQQLYSNPTATLHQLDINSTPTLQQQYSNSTATLKQLYSNSTATLKQLHSNPTDTLQQLDGNSTTLHSVAIYLAKSWSDLSNSNNKDGVGREIFAPDESSNSHFNLRNQRDKQTEMIRKNRNKTPHAVSPQLWSQMAVRFTVKICWWWLLNLRYKIKGI